MPMFWRCAAYCCSSIILLLSSSFSILRDDDVLLVSSFSSILPPLSSPPNSASRWKNDGDRTRRRSIGGGGGRRRGRWLEAPTTTTTTAASSSATAAMEEEEEEEEERLALDDYLPPSHPLRSLLETSSEACVPLEVDGINANGDGSFRYEWGTWCSRTKLDALSDALGELRLHAGAYDDLLHLADDGGTTTTTATTDNKGGGRRIRIASGKYWDVMLHLLPKSARVQHKWPEGSWTVLQPLTGVIEVSQLRGPDRDGYYVPTRPKDLRGGGDGSGAIGSGGGGDDDDVAGGSSRRYSTAAGEGSGAKYLGGPLRRYAGKAMSGSTLLEVNVRPPIEANVDAAMMRRYGGGVVDDNSEGGGAIEMEEMDWEMTKSVFARVERKREIESSREEEEDAEEGSSSPTVPPPPLHPFPSLGLNKKLGMEFENVGGLNAQLDDIAVSGFREVLRRSSSSSLPAGARFVSRSFFRPRALPTTDTICCVLIGKRTHSSFVLRPYPPAPLTPTLRFD